MKRWLLPVTTVSMIIGVLVSVQYKSQVDERHVPPGRRVENLAFMLKSTEKANDQLSEQAAQLQERLSKLKRAETPLAEAPSLAYPPVAGPGLVVTLTETKAESRMDDGSSAEVHAEDLLKIVNELRAAGAEALALNDQRLVEGSEITCAGPTILVNKSRLVPPFVLRAIGEPETMMAALHLRGGVVEYLQFYGIQVNITKKPNVLVPMYTGGAAYAFAKPQPTKTAP